jgi:hypothetical protein
MAMQQFWRKVLLEMGKSKLSPFARVGPVGEAVGVHAHGFPQVMRHFWRKVLFGMGKSKLSPSGSNNLGLAKNFYYSNDLVPYIAENSKTVRQAWQAMFRPGDTYNVYNLGLGGNKKRIPNVSAHVWAQYAPIYNTPGGELNNLGWQTMTFPRQSLFQKFSSNIFARLNKRFNRLFNWQN